MKNKGTLLAAIATMMAGHLNGGGWGKSSGKSDVEKPNSDRLRNMSDEDLEWYRELPKRERAKNMRLLRAKYMWGV